MDEKEERLGRATSLAHEEIEPLAGQAIGVVREGHSPEPLRHADAYGRVVIDISGPGRHMIYATNLRPADAEDANWESDFVTLTFEVSE